MKWLSPTSREKKGCGQVELVGTDPSDQKLSAKREISFSKLDGTVRPPAGGSDSSSGKGIFIWKDKIVEHTSAESAEIETLEEMRRQYGKYAQFDLEAMVRQLEERDGDEV